jgi:peptidyl-prolyl cis-trans isomerase SurA
MTNTKTMLFKPYGSNVLWIFFLSFLMGSGSIFAQQPIILDKVVSQVGNEVILWSDIEEFYAYQKSANPNLPADVKCNILDNLMLKSLLAHEAKQDTTIILSDEEVEAQLGRRIDEILGMMNGDVTFFQEYYGKSVNEVKTDMRDDMRNQMLTEKMQAKILQDIKITPAEVKTFFDKIPFDSLPYFNSEVEISEVVMQPKVNDEQRKLAIEKLNGLKARIEAGEDFAVLAKSFSDDPGSARLGGDLGWQKRGSFVQEFEEAAYRLEVNELSQVVESSFGFHLIQLLERRGNTFHTRHILIKAVITEEDEEIVKVRLDSIRTQILDAKLTFDQAVRTYSAKTAQSQTNNGRISNPKSGNTFFEIADLDPDVYFAVDSLKPLGITPPLEFQTETGEKIFKILRLDTRTPPHKANLQQDFSKIKLAAIEQKKAGYLNEWIIERAQSNYVFIDPQFKGCEMLGKWRANESAALKP